MVVKIRKKFCLTFDLEEFDIPKNISEEESYNISYEGTKRILNLLKEEGIRATFFTTAKFAIKYPKLIAEISKEHEIASHGYAHNHNYKKLREQISYKLIKKSKEIIEGITKKEIQGFRAPRMMATNPWILKKIGFKYDSSYQPALIPGRYLDFLGPRKMHYKNGLIIIPTSVTPIVRIPLMWYGFKNFGLVYAKAITRWSLVNNDYASVYFHSWEFANIDKYKLSWDVKRNTGERTEKMVRKYIKWCKRRYDFATMKELIKS